MKSRNKSILICIILSLSILLSFILPTNTVHAALGISGVNPNTITNQQSNSITITGTDFVSGSEISLEGYGSLVTTFFSSTTLLATVPSGIPVGIYTITVTNPDSSFFSLENAITVNQDPPSASSSPTSEASNGYERPVLVVDTYSVSQQTVSPGDYFTIEITLFNAGQHFAHNVVATFTPGDLIPRETGGVVAAGDIAPDNHLDFNQPFFLSTDVWGYIASLNMTLTYADETGFLYNETFIITLPVYHPYTSSATATPTPTITPTPSVKPQLVITSYRTNITPLQPGNQFELALLVQNMGATTAKRVTMIVGGGSSISGGDGGTQQPGGISGGSGEFTNFAPIGSSNVQSLGDFLPGGSVSANQTLIVNTSTMPGAYPLKISFVYIDEQNHAYTDDQVITLLVYRLPLVDINFYQELSPLFTGQMNLLPLQVVNLGRNSVVLGTMRVNASMGQFSNNQILVGTLESGGYFTLDASYMPDQSGPVDLMISIDYTNDFNQPQIITKTLSVEVIDQPIYEPPIDDGLNGNGQIIPPKSETFIQKIWRFILGLIGLDSGVKESQSPVNEFPMETSMPEEQPIVIPAKPLKGP